MTTTWAIFLSGVCMATFAAAGVFFLKFWRASKDRFFLYFCIACWLLALERILLLKFGSYSFSNAETGSLVYLVRLFAFVLISIGVIQKNRRA